MSPIWDNNLFQKHNTMSEHTRYKCSCLDEIEKDITSYLDSIPIIADILQKKELSEQDVFDFIKIINSEISEIIQYYMMKGEIKRIDRESMEEEYLDDAGFPYNIHRREWFSKPCPSYKEEIEVEEDVVRGRGIDDYYIDRYEYIHIESCFHYPGFRTIVLDCMKTYLYNKLSSGIIHKYLHLFIDTNPQLQELISPLEEKLACTRDTEIYSRLWKGSWFYFYRIFGFPKYFSKHYYIFDFYKGTKREDKLITEENKNKHKVDIEKCKLLFYSDFNSLISGHPMASNGIFQEGLQELKDLGYF